jgi:hypothetical protein
LISIAAPPPAARDACRNIAWRAAGLEREADAPIGAARRDEIDDEFAESGDVKLTRLRHDSDPPNEVLPPLPSVTARRKTHRGASRSALRRVDAPRKPPV